MAIDTSAFDRYKKDTATTTPNDITKIDISAFGMEWEKPGSTAQSTATDLNSQVRAADAEGRANLQDSISRLSQRDMSQDVIQSPESVPGGVKSDVNLLPRFVNKMRDILPKGLSEPLFGTGNYYGPGASDTGMVGFIWSGLTKPMQERIDNRVEKLTQPREIDGQYFSGIPEERAAEIAWADIMGDVPDDLTPLEQKLINSAGRWEMAEAGLDSLDFIPIIGSAIGKGGKQVIKRIAKFTDEITIGKEVDKFLPKLDPGIKARIVPQLAAARTEDQVQRIFAEAVQDAARIGARADSAATPAFRVTRTGNTTPVSSAVDAASPIARSDASAFLNARRKAPDIRKTRARIEPVLQRMADAAGVELDPARLRRGLQTFDVNSLDERIRFYAKDDPTAQTVFDKLRQDIELEREVFKFENPKVDLTTPEGERLYQDSFFKKFGVSEKEANNIKFVNRVFKSQQTVERVAMVANEMVNATPVQIAGKTVRTLTDVAPEAKVADDVTDRQAIKDLAKRDQTTLRPTRAAGDFIAKGRDLAKEIEGNIAKYNAKLTNKEIADIRAQNLLGAEDILDIISRKRGIITDAQSIQFAKGIKGTLQDIIDLPKGVAVTKEQKQAIEQIIQSERERNLALRTLIDNGGVASTPAEKGLLKRLGQGYDKMSDAEILNRAFAESTYNLKRAEIVYLGIRAEAGRTLQSMNKIVSGVDTRLRTVFNLINNSKKYDELEKQAMIEMISKLDVDDNVQFLKVLDMFNTADLLDKIAEWSVAAKLWNPTTHIVNFGGNALRQVADIGVKTVTNPTTAGADFMGAYSGLKQGIKNFSRAWTDEGYAQTLAKYLETGGTAPAIKGEFGKYARTPFRVLAATDEIFRTMAFQRKLYRDAFRAAKKEGLTGKQFSARMEELLNTPSLKMLEDATAEGKRMTFQEELGTFMRDIDKIRNVQAGANVYDKSFRALVRFFVPFLKTPTNLFKQSLDMSPIGLIKNQKALREAIKKGDTEKAGTIIGEAMLGTAIALWVGIETLDGNITGGAPKDPKQRDKFYREQKLPYAIKIGDTWYQYKRIDPFATIIGLTSDIVAADERDFGSIINITTSNLQDKTYLAGIADLVNLVSPNQWEQEYSWKNMVLGATMPSIIGHTTRSIDPVVRDADSLAAKLLVQIPGMSQDFPAKVNVLGYDVERANKGLNYFFNPVQSTSAEIDPVTQEFMKINYTLPIPEDNFSRDKVSYKFTNQEYSDYAKYVGLKMRFELPKLFESPRYQNADDEKKIALITKMRKEAMDEYKDAFVAERGTTATPDRVQQMRNILQGNDPNAPAEPDTMQRIRDAFIGE